MKIKKLSFLFLGINLLGFTHLDTVFSLEEADISQTQSRSTTPGYPLVLEQPSTVRDFSSMTRISRSAPPIPIPVYSSPTVLERVSQDPDVRSDENVFRESHSVEGDRGFTEDRRAMNSQPYAFEQSSFSYSPAVYTEVINLQPYRTRPSRDISEREPIVVENSFQNHVSFYSPPSLLEQRELDAFERFLEAAFRGATTPAEFAARHRATTMGSRSSAHHSSPPGDSLTSQPRTYQRNSGKSSPTDEKSQTIKKGTQSQSISVTQEIKKNDFKSIEEDLKSRGITGPGKVFATYAVALASQNPKQDFFGFDPKSPLSQKAFQEVLSALEREPYRQLPLLKDWISQSHAAIKMVGFLNSFGHTLPLADPEGIGSTLVPKKSVNPMALLDKAYHDMSQLISGQIIAIDENRKATKEEQQVLIQAAQNIGRKKTLELGLSHEPNFSEIMMDALLEEYNLLDLKALNKTTRRHNAILLRISLNASLGRDLGQTDEEINALFRRKGFDRETIQEVDEYRDYVYKTFLSLQPIQPLEDVIMGRLPVYENTPKLTVEELAQHHLRDIEILGLEEVFVYEKLLPYGQPAFEALKEPGKFTRAIWKESKKYPFTETRRNNLRTMLHEMEKALIDPTHIHEIHGFGYGSVVKEGKRTSDERRHALLTKRTWLSACYDFIEAYFYAKQKDCLAEFYADATPPDNAPCLPGKLRSAHEWFESKTMLVDDISCILEKVFAGMAGIELTSAVQQLYRKYVWANLEIYRAENGGIPVEEAKKQDKFKKEYLTLQAIKEGLIDMVIDNLPSVIRKYRSYHSTVFPIKAFHSFKYGEVSLKDGLGADDFGLTNHNQILQRQARANEDLLEMVSLVIDWLDEKELIDVYRPPHGLMSFS